MTKSILVADDDPHIRRLLKEILETEGFQVITASNGQEACIRSEESEPDLIILDVIMPKMSGFEVCKRIRSTTRAPILFLTAKDDIADLVSGLAIGGDDYMTKPFKGVELLARVKAALRRVEMAAKANETDEPVAIDDLVMDRVKREVTLRGEPVELTQTEFDLMWLLASNRGTVFSRKDIVKALWGYDDPGFSRSIDTHIARLRKKIEEDAAHPAFIKTVTGIGYKFA
ncbi:MAG: response regulator transcription factor [Candidatus Geothermincolia bacterium]